MNDPRIVALAGGVGGAKLAAGLQQILAPGALTVIVNTADDFDHWGLTVCPDLDTVMYNLAGVQNPETGWGRAGDTFATLGAMELIGGEDWFRIGDRDLATHLRRSEWLREGTSLTEVTERLSRGLGVPSVNVRFKSTEETRRLLSEGDADKRPSLVEKWRKKVDGREEARVMEILDIFGLDVYRSGDALPSERIWIPRESPIADRAEGAGRP